MQEVIIVILLVAAVTYIGFRVYKTIAKKNVATAIVVVNRVSWCKTFLFL